MTTPTPVKMIRVAQSSAMSFDPAAMLTIRVGELSDKKDFIAHASFLISRSEFFRRALNGKWQESESRIVNLPEDDPRVFALYLNHVYTGQLPTMNKTEEELDALERKDFIGCVTREYGQLFRAYVLAEKLQDVTAKNAIVTAVFEVIELRSRTNSWACPAAGTTKLVYDGTTEGSPARRFLTDMYTSVSLEFLLENSHALHPDFRRDLAAGLEKVRPRLVESRNPVKVNGVAAYLETL